MLFDNLTVGRVYRVGDTLAAFIRYNDNEYTAGENAFFGKLNGDGGFWVERQDAFNISECPQIITIEQYGDITQGGRQLWEANKDTLRLGQAYFNYLDDNFPTLANFVRGTDCDPFYVDGKVVPFMAFIATFINHEV
jgi:hypothetical protein